MAIALREAEDEAFEASLKSGLCGVLTLEEPDRTVVGAHTGVLPGRCVHADHEPAGRFLPKTVRVFRRLEWAA